MAYTKVADRPEADETVVAPVEGAAETTKTAPKPATSASKSSKDDEIEELKKRNDELNTKLEMLMQMIANGSVGNNTHSASRDDDVKIIHLIQCYDDLKTHIHVGIRDIDMSVIGETRVLSRQEAEELAGNYRGFFERGVIAFCSENSDFAERFNLESCVSDGKVNKDFAKYIGEIGVADLEKLYSSLGEAQKAFVIETFKRKITENDPRYNDMAKIQLLDRLTMPLGERHGAMEGVLADIDRAAAAQHKKN